MLYFIAQIGFILLSLICILIVYLILKKTERVEASNSNSKLNSRFLAIILIWFVIISVLSLTGFLSDFSTFPPRLFIVLIIPLVFSIWLLNRRETTATLLQIPPQWLLYFQGFRLFVELLLCVLFVENLLPIQMTFEGRNYDILIGITGPIIGYVCFEKKWLSNKVAIIWNFVGLAVLLNILVIAVLSMPSPIRVFLNDPANTIVAIWPFVLLPSILVPFAYYTHLLSLKQLFGTKATR